MSQKYKNKIEYRDQLYANKLNTQRRNKQGFGNIQAFRTESGRNR